MKSNPRFYYTIGILIALCATALAKTQSEEVQKSRRYLRNRKAYMTDWGNLAFELEPRINQEEAYGSLDA